MFKDYRPGLPADVKPTHHSRTSAKVYYGSTGVLYRVYTIETEAVSCMDVVFPYKAPFVARDGKLFHTQSDEMFVSRYRPKVAE